MSVAKVIPIQQRRSSLRVGRRRYVRERRRGYTVSKRWTKFRSMDRLYVLLAGLVGGLAAGSLVTALLLR